MKVEGEKQFDAPRGTVWQVLNDPTAMAKTMPGVESFDVKDDRHWTANGKIPLGLGGLKMTINMEKLEEAEADEETEPEAGTSGGDEGVSPWAPEAYEPEPEGPTTSTED